jgi:hypothetical protein
VRKRLAFERLEQDFNALLEHLAVGVPVEELRAEGLDFTDVVAVPDAKDDPPAGMGGEKRRPGKLSFNRSPLPS